MSRRRKAVVTVVLVLVAGGLAGGFAWKKAGDGARPGDVFDSTDTVSGTSIDFPLPAGAYRVTVSQPGPTVDLDPFNAQVPTEAARGSSYVGVSRAWVDQSEGFRALMPRTYLVVDGRRYAVASRDDQLVDAAFTSSTVALAVPGESPDVTVEVDYDGLTLTADAATGEVEPGIADTDAVTGTTTSARVDPFAEGTPAGLRIDPVGDGTATLAVRRTTYLPELGWVDGPDQRYLVATLTLEPGTDVDLLAAGDDDRGDGVATYAVVDLDTAVTLDGEGPGVRLPGGTGVYGAVERRVWVVDADRPPAAVTGATTVRLEREYGRRPVPQRLTTTGVGSVQG